MTATAPVSFPLPRRRRGLALLCLPLAFAIALPAQAWGPLGHRLVARLAEPGLDPQARAEVERLLQGEADPTLAGIANWADNLRGSDPELGKRSARWHYVNIADPDCHYDAARDCPGGNCAVEALGKHTAILADRTQGDAARRQALKFVVHLVGDLHQPLHAGRGEDRGGNDYQVNWRGKGSNMHSLWDSGMLNSRRMDEERWLERLQALPAVAASPLPEGAPRLWAEQSCRIAAAPGFYPPGHAIGEAYVEQHLPTAEKQLRLGGERLAATLNAVLGGTD
ncbi:S1/P1 nuclease [Pseudoxanthomonas suwonensis]|uniref:S1/P1 nuclease n=1 Tax=Pseudoxanthomonas suwonensis TaxID=314722 RepID=UPI0004B7C42A|nr:S1/P1 nuclease [Pseudoxanthomonas suwonensis]